VYNGTLEEGWVKSERRAKAKASAINDHGFPESWHPDGGPDPIDYNYPSGHILPFHYKHPVTGKKTSEEQRNKENKRP
jgi:hypothetical protein